MRTRAPVPCIALFLTAMASGDALEVGAFSRSEDSPPPGWEPLSFPKVPEQTRYAIVVDDGVRVLRAESRASASGLTREIAVDLAEYPILRWRWKVANVLEKGDVSRKAGDDYAARVYVTFEDDPGDSLGERLKLRLARVLWGEVPGRALSYIWASRAPVGGIYPSPYTDFVRLIAVESGASKAGRWVEEERDLREDYVRAFGREPPRVNGIAVMTDTDDTGESAVAWYGDISFRRRRSS